MVRAFLLQFTSDACSVWSMKEAFPTKLTITVSRIGSTSVANCLKAMVATLAEWAVESEFMTILLGKLSYGKGVTCERSILLGGHRAVSTSGQFFDTLLESAELASLIMRDSSVTM